jgi:shikimate kinase
MAIVLIGPAGCGAPEVAPLLAEQLSQRLVDVSNPVTADGRTLADLYVGEGADAARELEGSVSRVALDEAADELTVVCLPSAAPLDPHVAGRLERHTVIYLSVDAATAAARTGLDGPRPASLLPPRPLVRAHLAATDEAYRRRATHIIDSSGLEAADVAKAIARTLAAHQDATP